ncbi:DAK2 domain-containing protein [Cryobacterium sp. Hh7]|nr:DAK2 domain-containing protein [Cryobacterium sp. Hh7]
MAKRGRASYTGDRAIGHVDPGARAIEVWLGAIHEVNDVQGSNQHQLQE